MKYVTKPDLLIAFRLNQKFAAQIKAGFADQVFRNMIKSFVKGHYFGSCEAFAELLNIPFVKSSHTVNLLAIPGCTLLLT